MCDHEAYMRGEYSGWVNDRDGALAGIILLDQWSRNMYRNQAKAFASDALALEITLKILANEEQEYSRYRLYEKQWILFPLEHSEDKAINARMITEIDKLIAKM